MSKLSQEELEALVSYFELLAEIEAEQAVRQEQ